MLETSLLQKKKKLISKIKRECKIKGIECETAGFYFLEMLAYKIQGRVLANEVRLIFRTWILQSHSKKFIYYILTNRQ